MGEKSRFSLIVSDSPLSPLHALRQKLLRHALDGWLLPHQDMFQGEYLVEHDEWIQWLTGFSGSAGFAIVLDDKAAVFVDGRYTLQAGQQVDRKLFELHPLGSEKQWLKENADPQGVIGFDPWVFTEKDLKGFKQAYSCLNPMPQFLDSLWERRPSHPQTRLFDQSPLYTGVSALEKLEMLRKNLSTKDVDAFLLPPESWAWLLNVRGSDLPYTPLSQGFAWITQKSVDLFLHQTQQEREGVHSHRIEDLETFLLTQRHVTLGYDPYQTPVAVVQLFPKKHAMRDPCLLMKACKNAVEIEGAKQAHIKDAVAWCFFWYWLEEQVHQKKSLTELDIVSKIRDARQQQEGFHCLSFSTIAGSGPNGAIVHYKPELTTNRAISAHDLLLIDSGGQYLEGTTDVTRTLAIGTPTQEMKHHYTLVLRGHSAIASVIFPKGTSGAQLDVLARHALWQEKLNYTHGTGHGVGSFLSVHEGPQSISKQGDEPLQPGMILSNEPGYYKEGCYGIRIENLIYVIDFSDGWYGFENLTLIPFDKHLVAWELLTSKEIQWLRTYHQKIYETLKDAIPHPMREWFYHKCHSFIFAETFPKG